MGHSYASKVGEKVGFENSREDEVWVVALTAEESWGERRGSQTVGFTAHADGQWAHLKEGRALLQNPRLNQVAKSSH